MRRALRITALAGAGFVLACDVVGRLIRHPYEIAVGAILGVLGVGGAVAFALGAAMLFDDLDAPGFELSWWTIGSMTVLSLLLLAVTVVPALDRLGEFTDVSLAISLHAPNDELRNQLVPINKKYPIAMLLDSAKRYIAALPDTHRKITIEYTLIDQVNDRPEHARQLAELLRDVPVKINLIPFNPFSLSNYKRVSNNALRRFQQILMDEGYTTTVRTTRGDDIEAACGQLAGQVNDRTRRSARYMSSAGAGAGVVDELVRIVPHSP